MTRSTKEPSFLRFIDIPNGRKTMSDPVVDKIQNHPKYKELRAKRGGFGWLLAVLMLAVYYGYIALIAFNKPFLAQPIGAGVTSVGIPLGMGVIVFTIVITGIYVNRANSEYDKLTKEILEDATK
jgi:uncharacterized membrane protein (DUF485 family)